MGATGVSLSDPSTTLKHGFLQTREAEALAGEYWTDAYIQEAVSFLFGFAFGNNLSAEFTEESALTGDAGRDGRMSQKKSSKRKKRDDDDDDDDESSGDDDGGEKGRGARLATEEATRLGMHPTKFKALAAQSTANSHSPALSAARGPGTDQSTTRLGGGGDGRAGRGYRYSAGAPSSSTDPNGYERARAEHGSVARRRQKMGMLSFTTDRSFNRHLDEYFAPFAREAMHQIYIQGYAVYKMAHVVVASSGGREWVVPHVLPIGTYHVRFELTINHETRYEVWDMRRTGLVPNAFVYMDRAPNFDSKGHQSVMRSVIGFNMASSTMLNYALRAENTSTQPPMVLQNSAHASRAGGGPGGAVGEADLVSDSYGALDSYREAEGRIVKRTALEAMELMDKLQMAQAMNRGDQSIKLDGRGGIHRVAARSAMDGLAVLPAGKEVAKQQMPAPRSDLLPLMEQRQTNVCVAFGVPRNVLVGDSGSHAASVTAMSLVFKNKVATVRDTASKLLCEVYQRIYGESDLYDTLLDLSGSMHPASPTCGGLRAEWVFGSIPTLALEELRGLYQDNVMSHKSYAKFALKIGGIDASDANLGADGGFKPPAGTDAAYAEHMEGVQHRNRMEEECNKAKCAQKVEETRAEATEQAAKAETEKTLQCVGAECEKMKAQESLLKSQGSAEEAGLKRAEKGNDLKQRSADADMERAKKGIDLKRKAADSDFESAKRSDDFKQKSEARKDKRDSERTAKKAKGAPTAAKPSKASSGSSSRASGASKRK
jgi:hypothetical protein